MPFIPNVTNAHLNDAIHQIRDAGFKVRNIIDEISKKPVQPQPDHRAHTTIPNDKVEVAAHTEVDIIVYMPAETCEMRSLGDVI